VRQRTTNILGINNLLAGNLARSSLRARIEPLTSNLSGRLLWPDKQKLSKGHFMDEVITLCRSEYRSQPFDQSAISASLTRLMRPNRMREAV
jgi:hypothetical protein